MNDATIGRNYAETLLILAQRNGDEAQEEWGTLIEELGTAMRQDQRLRTFLESPKISAAQKI
jgi:F0F1-type ATP synthase delta subunit